MLNRTFLAVVLTAILMTAGPAYAVSVRDYAAMSAQDQTNIVVAFVNKMTGDLNATNPQLSKNIHDFFFVKPQGKDFAEGMLNLSVEEAALESLAKEGKVDLSKIEIEGVIVKVVKEKFPPQAAQ
jgi:soluble cytochrome b562